MARTIVCFCICLTLMGCKAVKPSDDKGEPIVSPSNISTEKQDAEAPSFPYFIPWWAKQK